MKTRKAIWLSIQETLAAARLKHSKMEVCIIDTEEELLSAVANGYTLTRIPTNQEMRKAFDDRLTINTKELLDQWLSKNDTPRKQSSAKT